MKYVFLEGASQLEGEEFWEAYERLGKTKAFQKFNKAGLVYNLEDLAKEWNFFPFQIKEFVDRHYLKSKKLKFYEAVRWLKGKDIHNKRKWGLRLISIEIEEEPLEICLQLVKSTYYRYPQSKRIKPKNRGKLKRRSSPTFPDVCVFSKKETKLKNHGLTWAKKAGG